MYYQCGSINFLIESIRILLYRNNRRSFSEDLPENVSQLGLTTAIQRLYYFKAHYLLAYIV